MIKIKVKSQKEKLENPAVMFEPHAYGTVFQQYFRGKPDNTYFIHCGIGAKHLITVWYNDEDNRHELSTDSIKDINSFTEHVKVKRVDADIKITLETNNA